MPIANFPLTIHRKRPDASDLRLDSVLVAFWQHVAKAPHECSGRCQKILV